MSLLLDSFTKCIMMDKSTVSDGRGGVITKWTDGAEFDAGIYLSGQIEQRIAEVANQKDIYKVLTFKNVILGYHDVFRRLEDGRIFRVTSDGYDKKTPDSASYGLREVNAEEFIPAE